jgi:hypothetical protein
LFTTKIERDKPRANFASALADPQLAVQGQSGERFHRHLCTNIEQVAHQGALPLHDSPPATKLRPSKNHAGTRFLSRLSRLVISPRKITRLFPAPCKVIRFQLSDQLILISGTSPSRVCKTGCAENRRLSGPAIPPPALTPRCAGTSDDRPDLPADDWAAPCTTERVAAAAIGLVVSSFAGAGAAMRSDSIARQQEQKN